MFHHPVLHCIISDVQKVSVIVSSQFFRAEGRPSICICKRSDLFVFVSPSIGSGGPLKCRRTHRLWRSLSLQGIPAKGHLNGARIRTARQQSPSRSAECSQKALRDTEIKSRFHMVRKKQASSLTNPKPGAPMCRYGNVTCLGS